LHEPNNDDEANGSGKSTLFRLLMACDSNTRPIDLHESIKLVTPIHQWDLSDESISSEGSCKVPSESCAVIDKVEDEEVDGESIDDRVPVTSITLPSSDIVEISQNFYWPLYARPVDWICQEHVTPDSNEAEREACTLRVVEELQSLSFSRSQEDDTTNLSRESNDASEARNVARSNDASAQAIELHEEKEDWFSQLSGGQKGKVELVRKVFLRNQCPSVLLGENCYLELNSN
jgi:ATPase subunit of ABC transporter with duplicated ATPase domains